MRLSHSWQRGMRGPERAARGSPLLSVPWEMPCQEEGTGVRPSHSHTHGGRQAPRKPLPEVNAGGLHGQLPAAGSCASETHSGVTTSPGTLFRTIDGEGSKDRRSLRTRGRGPPHAGREQHPH